MCDRGEENVFWKGHYLALTIDRLFFLPMATAQQMNA